MSWFFRLFEATDHGWKNVRTPDGRAIGEQDAYFWLCLEEIARTMNLMMNEEARRMAGNKGG